MGELILCTHREARQPLLISDTGFEVYSLEELCFYLEENFYLLDHKIINYSLCLWIRQELDFPELAESLDHMLHNKASVYEDAILIFEKSGFYDDNELEHFKNLVQSMDGKTVLECRKVQADQYLKNGKYVLAASCYQRILKPENLERVTDELRGRLYHNLGVCYARMFLFQEASQCFHEAYQHNRMKESREAYMYALNYIGGEASTGHADDMDLDLKTMGEIFSKFQSALVNTEYFNRRRQIQDAAASNGNVSESDRENILEQWKKEYEEVRPFS